LWDVVVVEKVVAVEGGRGGLVVLFLDPLGEEAGAAEGLYAEGVFFWGCVGDVVHRGGSLTHERTEERGKTSYLGNSNMNEAG